MRKATAWALYWMGDAVSRTFGAANWIDERLFGCEDDSLYPFSGAAYAVYSKLMCWSSDIQGDGPGPWEKAEVQHD